MPDPTLAKTLEIVRSRIAQAASRPAIGEQNTKIWLIEPVLEALGWNVRDIDEVRREFRLDSRDCPVDYSLSIDGKVQLLVEAKGLTENLNDRKWRRQCLGYANETGVRWIALTNGDEWWLYNALAEVHIDEKQFFAVKVSVDAAAAERALVDLSRQRMKDKPLETKWKRYQYDQQVEVALREILGRHPPKDFLKLLEKRLPRMPLAEIRESYGRADLMVTFRSAFGPENSAISKPKLHLANRPGESAKRKRVVVDVSLANLVAAGIVKTPLKVFADYRGKRLVARVEPDGRVAFDGTQHESLSAAGTAARLKALGSKAKGMAVNTNGWSFWKFAAAGGKSREIGELRKDWIAMRERSERTSAAKG